jgi:hypothetical protein
MNFNPFKRAKAITDTREYQLRCVRNWYEGFELVIENGRYRAKFSATRRNSYQFLNEYHDDGDALIGYLYYSKRETVWGCCCGIEHEKNDIR